MKEYKFPMELAIAKLLETPFNAISHRYRLLLLDYIAHGEDIPKILQVCGITRAALQKHIEMLKEAGIIEKGKGKRPYELTSYGEVLYKLVERSAKELVPLQIRNCLKHVSEDINVLLEDYGHVFKENEIKKLKEAKEILNEKLEKP
jgi:predicted transcriptional regulator